MNKQGIAFLCFSSVPYTSNWGSSQRIYYMANSLCRMYDVTVIGAKNTNIPKFVDLQIHYKNIFFENEIGQKVLQQKRVSFCDKSFYKKTFLEKIKNQTKNIGIGFCKVINRILFNEPVYFMGFIASYWIYHHAQSILNYLKENQIKVLVISIPPWNMISLSFLKKVKTLGCKLVIDYRDPWNCWNDNKGFSFRKERKIVEFSDMIFTTNVNHRFRLISDFNLHENKVKVIMNGYDENLWKSIVWDIKRDDKEFMVISFIGTISFHGHDSFRNPTVFMQALSEFAYKENIKFRVVGCYDQQAIERYKDIIPHFEMIQNVSQKESLEWMMRSDVLVNFHTTNDRSCEYLIAGKIFDYYRSGKRIFSINGKSSYERKFIEDNNLGYFSENEVYSIKTVLLKMYLDWKNNDDNFSRNMIRNDHYSRDSQNEIAVKYIQELFQL